MGYRKIKGMRRALSLDYYYSVLRRDWRVSTFLIDILLKGIAIIVVSIHRFINDNCHISASALTFYSMLSIIPIVALTIAIARGFGVDSALEQSVTEHYFTDPQIVDFLISFAKKALAYTEGGIVTGVGIVILLWTIIRVLSSVELTLNDIWGIYKGRTLGRKITEYMSILFIVPLLFIVISTINVFLTTNLQYILPPGIIYTLASSALMSIIKLVPYLLVWVLFIFIYMFMPTTSVKFKHAFWAGVIAGTVFQIVQWFYIRFQVGVSSYNAVYGSLAALPLLLVWIQLSWSIILWGAELCYVFRNKHFLFKNDSSRHYSWVGHITIAIRIMTLVAIAYQQKELLPTLSDLSKKLRINTAKLRLVIDLLIENNFLIEVEGKDECSFYPARDLHQTTVGDIVIKLTDLDENAHPLWQRRTWKCIEKEFKSDTILADIKNEQA